MNKRNFVILLAGTMAVTSAAGLTACDGLLGNEPEGEVKVTATEWEQAFENTLSAESYTAALKVQNDGSYSENEGEVILLSSDTVTGTSEIDFVSKKISSSQTIVQKEGGEEETVSIKNYAEVEDNVYWSGYNRGGEWEVRFSEEESAEEALNALKQAAAANVLNVKYSAAEEGETQYLKELYSAFTYDGGKYSAKLWLSDSSTGDERPKEVQITVTIKNNYVTGFGRDRQIISIDDEITHTFNETVLYSFSKFGDTAVTAPEGAEEAISAKKAESAGSVTEDEWKAAFDKSLAANSYTMNMTIKTLQDGEYEDYASAVFFMDLGNKESYYDMRIAQGGAGSVQIGYNLADGDKYWNCSFYNSVWHASYVDCASEEEAYEKLLKDNTLSGFLDALSLPDSGEKADFKQLYELFEFNDGVYSATLMCSGEESEVTFTFKDGYISRFSNTLKHSYVTQLFEFEITKYDGTAVDAPEAKQAIEDKKAELTTPSVAGKTYEFYEIQAEYEQSVNAATEEKLQEYLAGSTAVNQGIEILFSADGDITQISPHGGGETHLGTYTQDGELVLNLEEGWNDMEWIIKGNELKIKMPSSRIIYADPDNGIEAVEGNLVLVFKIKTEA